MTASVCARCDAMVTTDSRIPTTPTRIPTRRVRGSAACSGVTSISGMTTIYPRLMIQFARRQMIARARSPGSFDQVQPRVGAGNTQDAAAHDLDNVAESADIGDEFADFRLGAGQFHDI